MVDETCFSQYYGLIVILFSVFFNIRNQVDDLYNSVVVIISIATDVYLFELQTVFICSKFDK